MNTTENNILIAEFMGVESYHYRGYTMFIFEDNNHRTDVDLHYHTSWEWLMPVVEKIEAEIGVNIAIGRMFCEIDYIDSLNINRSFSVRIVSGVKINATHEALVRFIKWYNNEKITK